MDRATSNEKKFLQYGLSADLAEQAAKAGLTVSKVRTLAIADLVAKFSISNEKAKILKSAVQRDPIASDTLDTLLARSNYTCNICKGTKSKSFIVHHIEPYARSQNNDYSNLVVLCPADHDLAHNSGLALGISPEQLMKEKEKWEQLVEKANAAKAARSVEVDGDAIDYFNPRRLEELAQNILGRIPDTKASRMLKVKGILDADGRFNQKFVQENLSNGRYLFDYINSGEALHYRELLARIAERLDFVDLSEAIDRGKKAVSELEGRCTFFIGGVYSNEPKTPITNSTPMVRMHYKRRKIRVEWQLDPMNFFSMSAIARQGSKNRYLIYSRVRTVDAESEPGQTVIKASAFLIAQPSTYANRIPAIGWEHRYGSDREFEY
ncbi:HNH endonuclease [Rhizobium sp. ERR 1071]|uniref:HNH endonuclease signature motif containing protein n=1 Tax=Rhizobium sp. ERR 1071 TaxID=2572677 RepID=UPI001198F940|nr:HNH endonuclease signature motif containing protein [Rhizobium sp. ERR1071]TWB20017.1 HNH endonuclease [Rhizobium sp. ERR1071]